MSAAITVIGCDGDPLSRPAAEALAAARCVAGSSRQLSATALPDGVDVIRIGADAAPRPATRSQGGLTVAGAAQDPVAGAAEDIVAGAAEDPVAGAAEDTVVAAAKDNAAAQASAFCEGGTVADRGDTSAGGAACAFDTSLSAILCHPGPVAVLASGDPGFFGIVRALVARGAAPNVVPATSSVALAFARLGQPWDDALVLSAHGRDARPVLAAALGCGKAAILTAPGPTAGPQRFIPALLAAGRPVYVAERLGTAAERLTPVTDGTPREFADPNIVIALDVPGAGGANEGAGAHGTDGGPDRNGVPCGIGVREMSGVPRRGGVPGENGARGAHTPDGSPGGRRWMAGHLGAPDGWALAENAFAHRDSMITKAEVRALVLARLGPGPGRTIWDIGSGSGSVAVECARFGAHAIAIEGDPAQCARIRANAAAHGVRLQLAEGSAPEVFAGLLPADAVFAGGGGDAALAAAAAAHPARVVVALATVDRVRTVHDLLAGLGYEVAGTALQASRLAGLPGGSIRLAAANPVFVLWGKLR